MSSDLFTLDAEASGLSNDSYPISIGISGPDNQSWYWLICPLEDWDYWDEFAQDRHSIGREHLIEKGRDPFLVAREINSVMAGKRLLVDSTWDIFWINRLFSDVGIMKSFSIKHLEDVFSKSCSTRIMDDLELVDWEHRADKDALVLRESIIKHVELEK